MAESRFRSLPWWTRVYVGIVVCAGALTILESLHRLWRDPVPWDWIILATLTLLSGSATVRLPSVPATISVSETFVVTSMLLFGPAAGTLTVALDALVISAWSYRKGHPLYKILFNVCALPLTIWLASHIFFSVAAIEPLYGTHGPVHNGRLLFSLLLFTIAYFSLNSWIITFAISLERGLRPIQVWRTHFPWLSLNYFGGASVAWLLVSYTRNVDYTYLIVILPLLVVLYFTFSVSLGRVGDANRHLEKVNSLYMSTIETLAMAIDAKDQITHGHIRRVQTYAVELARQLGVSDRNLLQAIEAAALLHDMGKLAVPEYILNKPGPLTAAEFEKMKVHASVGADILSAIDFPYPVVPIVRHHHENWNGTGYPDGLAGTEIPIGARILSVVDCFDALTSDRPYRPRLADKDALEILLSRRGSMYDPLIVDMFIALHDRIALPTPEPQPPFAAINSISAAPRQSRIQAPSLEEISASSEEMLTLFELARSLSAPMELSDVCDLVAKHLRRLVPCVLCAFYAYDEGADELVVVHAVGEHSGLLSEMRLGLGQRLSGWVAANRQTIRNSDATLDLGEAWRSFPDRPRSCLSTPLINGTSLVGVLTLYATRQNAFSEEHQRIIEIVAVQVSKIVSTAIAQSTTRLLHLRDHVTGLPNLEQVLQAVGPGGLSDLAAPTSLLLVAAADFSDFAKGRTDADVQRTVESLVRLTRQSLRAGDLLFRPQKDELCALLLQTDPDTSEAIAKRLKEAFIQFSAQSGLRVGVSVGHSTSETGSLHALVSLAREHLTKWDVTPRASSESIH